MSASQRRFAFFLIAGVLAAAPASAKPKHILISDSLLANSHQWNVKRNDKWTVMNRWAFGEYAVVDSKTGWITGGTHTNLFKTKTESHSQEKFSFVLSNKTDSAFVDAVRQVVTQSNPGLKVGKGVHVGGTGLTEETDRFIGSITIGRDTTEIWNLFIGDTEVSEWSYDREDLASHTSVLIQGERRIALVPVFSKKLDKKPSFFAPLTMGLRPPAMGYEFIEDGHSLCAVEYFSSGISGFFKNTVWMDKSAEPRLRLVLAAAMTSVLQLKCEVQQRYEPAEE
ncbi:MAG TPA: hypothetical protein VFQ05_14990 [Candidatus Eisenbacteria bacterium]|nr:hypothetical protein [Candidatus Eisenbacteria bacterium]